MDVSLYALVGQHVLTNAHRHQTSIISQKKIKTESTIYCDSNLSAPNIYTKIQVYNAFALKHSQATTYTKTEVDNELAPTLYAVISWRKINYRNYIS